METISDKNTLYISFDLATEQQISACIDHAIKQLKTPCKFFLNLVKNKNGDTFKYAYVWVSNSKVYNALTGLNLDGSKRVKMIKDPKWTPPKLGLEAEIQILKQQQLEEQNKNGNTFDNSGWCEDNFEDSWGDDPVEFDYKSELEIIKNKYVHPMVEIEKESLVKIPKYEWTQEQLKILKMRDEEYEEHGEIKIQQAEKSIYLSPDDDYSCSIFGKIPLWITNEEIVKIFKDFCTVKNIRTKNNTQMFFPFVKSIFTRTNFRTVKIGFKRGTKDAYFAGLMTRKIDFNRNGKKGMGFFNLSQNKKNFSANST